MGLALHRSLWNRHSLVFKRPIPVWRTRVYFPYLLVGTSENPALHHYLLSDSWVSWCLQLEAVLACIADANSCKIYSGERSRSICTGFRFWRGLLSFSRFNLRALATPLEEYTNSDDGPSTVSQ